MSYYGGKVPAFAELLTSSRATAIRMEYMDADQAATLAQMQVHRSTLRTNMAIFGTAVLTVVLLVISSLRDLFVFGNIKVTDFIASLALLATISGSIAAYFLVLSHAGNHQSRSRILRAKAERHRGRYITAISVPAASEPANRDLDMIRLEFFRRFFFGDYQRFFERRGAFYAERASAAQGVGAIAVWLAAAGSLVLAVTSSSLATSTPLGVAGVATLGAVSLLALALASYGNVRFGTFSAERYGQVAVALRRLESRLDEVRLAVSVGDRKSLVEFVSAVNEQTFLEHRQWLSDEALEQSLLGLDKALAASKVRQVVDFSSEHDIFLSYAREDMERVRPLVVALRSEGWTVFWDQNIAAGEHWRERLLTALNKSSVVLVVWSTNSIGSRYVQDEANRANERGVLIHLKIDEIETPFGHTNVQLEDFVDWASVGGALPAGLVAALQMRLKPHQVQRVDLTNPPVSLVRTTLE